MPKQKSANFALQGGGAHGAFTWGVLDKLLEDGRLRINALSGTSAGAMNAVVMADGLVAGGPDAAREKLHAFWHRVSDLGQLSPIQRNPIDVFFGNWSMDRSFGYHLSDSMTRLFSPYQINPLNLNPLLDILRDQVDFDRVRACDQMPVFISATNVETGKVKVFDRKHLTAEMVMASACLPMLYQAIEIDGVPYWDGGYMGNPSLFPFYSGTDCADIVIVQINPAHRPGPPKTAHDIINRINEISFNSSLLKELRSINFVSRLIEEGKLSANDYRDNRVHIIEDTPSLTPLGAASKMNAEWAFLEHLRDLGRARAEVWLEEVLPKIGKESSVDLRALFEDTSPP